MSVLTDVNASGEVELSDLESMANMCMGAIEDLRNLHIMSRSKQIKSLQGMELLVVKAESTRTKYRKIEEQLKRKRPRLHESLERYTREKNCLARENAEKALALDKEQKSLKELEVLVNRKRAEAVTCAAERERLETALAEQRLSLKREILASEELQKNIEREKETLLSLKSQLQRNTQINQTCAASKANYEYKFKGLKETELKLNNSILEEAKKQQVLLDRIGILTSKIAQVQLSNQRKQSQFVVDRTKNDKCDMLAKEYAQKLRVSKSRVNSLSEVTISAEPRKLSKWPSQNQASTFSKAQKPTLATVGSGQASTNTILTRCNHIGLFERL